MRTTACYILAVALLPAAALQAGDRAGDTAAALSVHLPRSVEADGRSLRLGDLAVLGGADAVLVSTCNRIAMGRAPWSGERLVITRPMVRARLATHGVAGDRVRFTGAEQVAVTRDETVTSSEAVAEAARTFLAEARPAPSECRWRLVREPDPIRAPAGSEVALSARPAAHHAEGEARVTVVAEAGGKRVGASNVLFRLTYLQRRLVAARDIAPGEVVSPENTRIEKTMADRPDPGRWSAPYGEKAARLIPAGQEVRPGLVQAAAGEILVHRNEGVVMRIQGALFNVTALGKALENGRPGDLVKVENIDSGRVVLARVARDGSVEPVMAER
jgi:flagella basal body P-ring formation protein FlgA